MKSRFFSCGILLLAVLFLLTPVSPASGNGGPLQTFWTGAVLPQDLDWFNPGNWDNGVPNSFFDAYIGNVSMQPFSAVIGPSTWALPPAPSDLGWANANNLVLGDQQGGTGGVLDISQVLPGGPSIPDLYVAKNFVVGGSWYPSSVVTQFSGSVVVGDTLQLGRYSGDNDHPQNYFFNGGNLWAQNAVVGGDGFGYFLQLEGTSFVVNADLNLGQYQTAVGVLDKRGGDLEMNGSLYVGDAGNGQYYHGGWTDPDGTRHYGGTTTIHSHLYIGLSDFGDGTFSTGYLSKMGQTGSGDFLHVDGDLIVGRDGNGTYDHGGYTDAFGNTYDGGETKVGGSLILGDFTTGVGTLNQAGGSIAVTGNMVVGNLGTGEVNQSGGDLTVGGDLTIHANDGSNGTYNQSGGTNAVTGSLYVGYDAAVAEKAEYNLSGTGQLSVKTMTVVGNIGSGTFNQSDATSYHETPGLVLGSTFFGVGTYNLYDGTLKVTTPAGDGTVTVGGEGEGYFNQSGGSLTSDIVIVGTSPISRGKFQQWGGSHKINYIMTVGQDNMGEYWLYGTGYLEANAIDLGLRGIGSGSLALTSDSAELKVTDHLTVGVADTDGLGNPVPGTGYFYQSGGTATVGFLEIGRRNLSYGRYQISGGSMTADWMTLGAEPGSWGEVWVHPGGDLTVNNDLVVGNAGAGSMTQTGGTVTVKGSLSIGRYQGEYNLFGDGVLNAGPVFVADGNGAVGFFRLYDTAQVNTTGNIEVGTGDGSQGYFYQMDGSSVNTNNAYLRMGLGAGSYGRYEMSGGSIDTGYLSVGFDGSGEFQMSGGSILAGHAEIGVGNGGSGTFVQSGGGVTVDNTTHPGAFGSMALGQWTGSFGSYEINTNNGPSTLTVQNWLVVGNQGQGSFVQNGGTVKASRVYVGYDNGSAGSTYTQNAGELEVTQSLVVGRNAGSSGAYTINDGAINTYNLIVGAYGTGAFTVSGGTVNAAIISVGNYTGTGSFIIDNAAAVVKVSESLTIGANATFNAVSGTTIEMTGADNNFFNYSQTPADVDMTGLKMFYSNNGSFEVAGKDLGAVMAGFTDNFALGTLEVAAGMKLTLTDLFPNQGGSEVLYVYNLILGAGSILDPDPMNLYYVNLFNYGGTFDPGLNPIQILTPLPGSLLLLGSALLGLGGWRRFRG